MGAETSPRATSSAKAVAGMVEENGKVTLPTAELGEQGRTIIKPKAVSDPVLVAKQADGTYAAFLLKCPHKGGPLKEKGDLFECDWHHSTFDLSGKVLDLYVNTIPSPGNRLTTVGHGSTPGTGLPAQQ